MLIIKLFAETFKFFVFSRKQYSEIGFRSLTCIFSDFIHGIKDLKDLSIKFRRRE